MFVVGLENSNYRGNLAIAEAINKIINNKYPNLSRGILKKQGAGVNGVYNQDISPNMMLIEVGGVDNNIEEVLNTIDALASILYEYIRGDN
jgi:stage II sporulation protein P